MKHVAGQIANSTNAQKGLSPSYDKNWPNVWHEFYLYLFS